MKLGIKDVEEADLRLRRFAPYIAKVFPEAEPTQGVIESPLQPVPRMQSELERLPQRMPYYCLGNRRQHGACRDYAVVLSAGKRIVTRDSAKNKIG